MEGSGKFQRSMHLSTAAPPTDVLRPTVAVVNLDHLRHNARLLLAHAGEAGLIGVVKADAYGHGAEQVTRALVEAGLAHFAVAILPEAIALREAGIDADLLVFGAPLEAHLPAYERYHLQLNVTSAAVARWVAAAGAAGHRLRVQVKVDTGMNRLGVHVEEAAEVIDLLSATPGITVEGVWTHLATADEPDSVFVDEQLARFRRVLGAVSAPPASVHVANSAGLLTLPQTMQFETSVLARPGIALYGLMEDQEVIARCDLRPVMTLESTVQHVHTVAAGETVSYGRRWTAARDTTVATIGTGYADGYPRILSNRARVSVQGRLRPVIGSVCMDMTLLDLGPSAGQSSVRPGDRVVLFGEGGPSAVDVARWAETISYEIVCGTARRVLRTFVG